MVDDEEEEDDHVLVEDEDEDGTAVGGKLPRWVWLHQVVVVETDVSEEAVHTEG